MPDIENITTADLYDNNKMKVLYVEAVRRGWWDNSNQAVVEFFSYAVKALHDDKQGTPGKLFYHLIKDKDNTFLSDAHEAAALSRINSGERQELVNIVCEDNSNEFDKVEEVNEDWLKWNNYSNKDIQESDDVNEDKIRYASDGALTWHELLTNTALLAAGKEGNKLNSNKKYSNFRKHDEDTQYQFDFFKASVVDVSYKDDTSLMDISPFGIGKKPRIEPIEYDLRDARIKVTANAEYGMATIYDYDIVIYIASNLNAQMNELKRKVAAGEKNPQLPPRRMRVYSSEMFDHLKIDHGGKQHSNLKHKLRRLKGTYIEVDKKIDGGYRREGSFSLIGDWEILSESKTGKITELVIGIPDWIYDGIVREADPTVLTLCDDYMLLKSGMHKWLARLAKKSAGINSWEWSLDQLYERSGSSQPLKYFRKDLIEALEKLRSDPIPEYSFLWEEVDTGKFRKRGKGRPKKDLIVTIKATGLKGRYLQSDRRKLEDQKHQNRVLQNKIRADNKNVNT